MANTRYNPEGEGGGGGNGGGGGGGGNGGGGGGGSGCGHWAIVEKVAPEKTIDKIPYDLSRLKPAESYSWIEGGSKVNTTMKKIPFTLGPHRIGRLPAKVSLKYKVRVWRGASCAGGGR